MNNSKFCRFCGTPLDGKPCDCPDATAARQLEEQVSEQSPEVLPEVLPEAPLPEVATEEPPILQEQPVIPQEQPVVAQEQPVVAQEQPVVAQETSLPLVEENLPDFHSYTPPSPTQEQETFPPPKDQGFQMPPQVAKAAVDIGNTFASFLKNPIAAIEKGDTVPKSNGFLLLGVNLFALLVLWFLFLFKTLGTLVNFKMAVVYPVFSAALSVSILFGFLFLVNKLFQGNGTTNGIFNLVCLSTIPWIGVALLFILTTLLFGAGDLSTFVGFFLFILGLALTTLILERGLRPMIPRDMQRMLLLSVAVALQITLTAMLFIYGVTREIAYFFLDFFGTM